MADKTAPHPDGIHIVKFNEQWHTYRDNLGSRYVSGTSFIKPFFPKFDAIAVSKKCAGGNNPLYTGRDPKEIRKEWLVEGKRGSSEGDNTHEYAEGIVSSWSPDQLPLPISARCELLFKQVDKIATWLLLKYKFIEAEKVIFSPSLGIAGMVDIIFFDPATQEILILDWKTNKNPLTTTNIWQSGFAPIDHLQETDINKYSLQLSLYQYIIEKENYFPEARGFRRALIHITPTTVIPIKLDYYKYEIKEMLNETKK